MRISERRIVAPWLLGTVCAVALSFFLTSCEERDFIDPNGPNKDQTSVQTLVTGIEAGMRVDFEFYVRSLSVIGRETYYLEPSDPRYTGELLGKNGSQLDPSGFLLVRSWGSRYRVIRTCYFLIEKGDRGASGFAKTIIAYQYLLNLNMTNGNGIRLQGADGSQGPLLAKAAALTEIVRLLDEGLADVKAVSSFSFNLSPGFAGTPTFPGFGDPSGFARFNRALRARVAAYQADIPALHAALDSSFISGSAPLSDGVYHSYSTASGDLLNPIFELPTASTIKLFAHPTFRPQADTGDTRVGAKTIVRSEATTFDGLTSDIGITVAASDVAPYPIIRKGELVLLRAEAYIAQSNYGLAEPLINSVRSAAGLGNVTLSAGNAVDELLKQRRYSLFLEGHRWIDMRRFNRLNQLPLDRAGDVVQTEFPLPDRE